MISEKPPGLVEIYGEIFGQGATPCTSPSDYEEILKKILKAETEKHISHEMVRLQQDHASLQSSHRALLSALERIRPVPERLLRRVPVACLDEVLAECDAAIAKAEELVGE